MKVKKNKLAMVAFFSISLPLVLFFIFRPQIEKALYFLENGNINESTIKFYIDNTKVLDNYFSDDQKNIDVLHYTLRLQLFPAERKIKGETTVKIKVIQGEKITLNFYDNLKVDSVLINRQKTGYERDEKHIYIEGSANSDSVMITIVYSGTPESMGFGSFVFGNYKESPVIYTLSEPVFASTWFPCNDLPTDKATADVFITNDSSFVSVSNGKLAGININGDKKTYHWKIIYPISTYLISVYSAKYVHFQDVFVYGKNDSMKVEYFVFPGHLEEAKKDFQVNVEALKVFSGMFGEYPFLKEKYGVAEFLWQLGAIEHQTITGIGSNFISGRQFFDDVYVHELAHQWWGDAVTVKSWKDIWLSEGFASYSEALYYENKSGHDALVSTMMGKAGTFEGKRLYNPSGNLFDRVVYNKGAWVLHMLRNQVGDENFWKILRNYYEKFKYKNASTEDFIKVCEETTGKDLKKFFDQWVYSGEGIPVLNYRLMRDSSGVGKFSVQLKLKQVQDGYGVYELPFEIRVRGYNGEKKDTSLVMNSKIISVNTTLNFKPLDVLFDPGNKLLAKFIKEEN